MHEKDKAEKTENQRRENQTTGRNAATAFFLAHTSAYPLYNKGEVVERRLPIDFIAAFVPLCSSTLISHESNDISCCGIL
jgi:hypothetical protein